MMPETNRIYLGDCVASMKSWPDNCVDAVVTDPPYELGFMGKAWDSTGIAYSVPMWSEVLRVLKPGGHLLAFSATRTYHRMACAIEDAGFEIRDQVQWLYGQGFPKSLNVSMAIDKMDGMETRRARALRFTAWMRSTGITAAQIKEATGSAMASHYLTDKEQPSVATSDMFAKLRPLLPAVPADIEELVRWRTVESENFKKRAVTGKRMAIDTTKVRIGIPDRDAKGKPLSGKREIEITEAHTEAAKKWEGWGTALKPANEPIVLARKPLSEGTVAENVMRWGTGALNINASRISCSEGDKPGFPIGEYSIDTAVGSIRSSERHGDQSPTSRWPANVLLDQYAAGLIDGKNGDASRVFYVAKPDGGERNAGLDGQRVAKRDEGREEGRPGGENPRNRGAKPVANFHPTVKPIDLMGYLITLVTPRGGVVLDPFLGSGTTAIAAARLGHPYLGCEMSAEYMAIAEARIASETSQGNLF